MIVSLPLLRRAAAEGEAHLHARLGELRAQTEDPEAAVERVASALWREAGPDDRPLIRALFVHALAERRRAGGCGDALYALAFLLYRVGQPEDALLLFEARRTNMDCGSMIDRDLLTMRRSKAEMLAFARQHPGLEQAVLEAFEHPDHETPEALERSVEEYFAEWSED